MHHHTRLTFAAASMIAIAVAGDSPVLAQAQQPATSAPATTASPATTPAPTTTTVPATSMPNQMEHGRPMGPATGEAKTPIMGGQGHPGPMHRGGMGMHGGGMGMHRGGMARRGSEPTDNVADQLNREEAQRSSGGGMLSGDHTMPMHGGPARGQPSQPGTRMQ